MQASGTAHPDALHCYRQHPPACQSIIKQHKKPRDTNSNRETASPAQWEIYSSCDHLSTPPKTNSCKRVRFEAPSHFGFKTPPPPNSHASLHHDKPCNEDEGHDTSISARRETQQQPQRAPTSTVQHPPAPTSISHSSTDGSVKVQTAVRDSGVEGEDEYSPRRPEGAAEEGEGEDEYSLRPPASPTLSQAYSDCPRQPPSAQQVSSRLRPTPAT